MAAKFGPNEVILPSSTSDSGNTPGSLYFNASTGALRIRGNDNWANVYEAPRTGVSAALAITEASDVANIVVSGAYYFNVGGSTFQTYVDTNLDGKGKWALVRKFGGNTVPDQTYNSGKYDIFDLGAHGTMTDTIISRSSKDTLSRDQINGLFRLNPDAGIMTLDFIENGCSAGLDTPGFYYLKKLSNRTTFDAWHGMFNNYLWGDQAENASGESIGNGGSAWKVTKNSESIWSNNNTDFTHQTGYAVKAWEPHLQPTPVGWYDSSFYTARHGPIYTDWTGGCRWLLAYNTMISYNAQGRVWVKI